MVFCFGCFSRVLFLVFFAVKSLIGIKKVSRKLFVGMWAAHNLWLYVFIVLERKDNNKRNALLKEFLLFWKEKLFYAKIFVKWF